MFQKVLTLSTLACTLALGNLPAGTPQSMAHAASAPQMVRELNGIQEYQLDNGLKVLLVENHSAPVVSVNIVYRVGSRNEAVGYTGSTHFLEHMLFKGTPKYNKAKGTQIANLLLKHGARKNATTWLDRTNYFETLPAAQLDLALDIEADRMRNSFIKNSDRQSEMSVVRNELERGENNPCRVMWLNLLANAFMAHPYHHPTIGWRSDVEGVPTERLKKFYQDFYYPNNATLIVVGDFETQQALKTIQKKFGPIAASSKPIPQVYTQEPPQQGERRFVINRPGQLGIVNMGFHVPRKESKDSYALDVLEGILSSGVSSRLQQALVEKQLAVSTYAFNMQLRDPGLFVLNAEVASGVSPQKVEEAMLDVIESLKKTPPTSAELEKVKNIARANYAFSNHGTHALASALSEAEASAEWRYLASYLYHFNQVTPADVQRVAQKYFLKTNRTVGHFVPQKITEVDVSQTDVSYRNYDSAQKTRSSQSKGKVQRFALKHEGQMVVMENHLDNTVALQGTLYAGSINEPKGKSGVASLTAHLLKSGTLQDSKLALAKKLESMGSALSFNSSLERLTFSGSSLSENLDATLQLLEDILKSPRFPQEEFDKEKKRLIDNLKKGLDDTNTQASDLLEGQLYPEGHPYHKSTQQAIKELENVTLVDVKDFYKKHYGAQKMIIGIVGDVDANQLKGWGQKAFQNWNPKNPTAIKIPAVKMQSRGQRLIKNMPDKANVSINMGVQSNIHLGHPDYFPAILANHALGQSTLSSRLGLKVRDELGLTYGIYSYFAKVNKGDGYWNLWVTTNPKNIEKTLSATKEVIEKYRNEGISAEELATAKSSSIGSYLVSLTTNPQIVDRLNDIAFYNLGDNYMTDRAKMIEAVTQSQVNAIIKKYFDPNQMSIAIAGKVQDQ